MKVDVSFLQPLTDASRDRSRSVDAGVAELASSGDWDILHIASRETLFLLVRFLGSFGFPCSFSAARRDYCERNETKRNDRLK